MRHSLRSFPGFVLVLVLIAGGCADLVTYSKDSRRAGIELYNRQAYADAAGAFRNAVRQNPRDYRSYYYLGACNDQLGHYQQAIAAYKTSYQVIDTTVDGRQDPDFRYRVLNGLAGAIARSDTREIELNSLENRVRTRSIPDDHYLLAKVYALRGDADRAIQSFERVITIAPNNFHYAREAGLYLESLGQHDRAVPILQRAYSLNNHDPQVIAALRRLNVVPGPSLKEEQQLARPLIPKGPIPTPRLPGSGVSAGEVDPIIRD
ncbi:MAG: tetratricopeptide repeat protein [Phycisphaerae bacterium]|nr:tetratricopeptide repeat protein [Phycisphaerae bacterium]MDW8262726.1 tetratricopeptide repeat protein [Phycisphaerales bacterium]